MVERRKRIRGWNRNEEESQVGVEERNKGEMETREKIGMKCRKQKERKEISIIIVVQDVQ